MRLSAALSHAGRLVAAALFFVPLISLPTSADVPTPPDDVTIVRCRSFVKMNAVQIKFRVNGGRTADAVAFAVSLGSKAQILTDVGTFAPGITIDHFFDANDALTHAFMPLTCAVEAIRFASNDAL